MGPKGRTVEEVLANLASNAHGVVTRPELLRAGITPGAIKRRLERGALIRVHRGVYRVGHEAPSLLARYLAAVLACGDGALLAGRAAAHLHRLLKGSPPPPEVLTARERRVRGVLTHRCRAMVPEDAATCRGIPVTTVPRTIVDLAAVLAEPALARAVHEAAVIHRLKPAAIERVLGRRHNWPGARALRRVLWGEVPIALSRLEVRFLEQLREAGLPLPETNSRVDGRLVDCRWPAWRLTVELDGYRYHHTRHAWEVDRRREREARARGDDFRRYTYRDVVEDPRAMLAELRAALGDQTSGR